MNNFFYTCSVYLYPSIKITRTNINSLMKGEMPVNQEKKMHKEIDKCRDENVERKRMHQIIDQHRDKGKTMHKSNDKKTESQKELFNWQIMKKLI